MKPLITRRNFVGGAVAGLGLVSFAGGGRRLVGAGGAGGVEQCKELYPDVKTIAAYEYFTTGLGKGRAVIELVKQVEVGQQVPRIAVVYTAEEAVAPGGMVQVWCPNGATGPQLDDAARPGFVQVKTDVAFSVALSRLCYRKMYDQKRDWRFVDVALPDGLPAGETIRFVWNNVTVDQRAARFDGDQWVFKIAVDHDADGFSELIPDPPAVPKHPGPAVRMLARVSSSAVVGEPVRLNICAFDRYDNPATGFKGGVKVGCDRPGVRLPDAVDIFSHGAVQCDVSFARPGFYWLTVRSADGSMIAESNPVEVFAEDPGVRLCWGDLHVHTEMSADARAGADTTSTYAGSYKIGKLQYALDFQANTDHQGTIQGNYGADDWERMCRITNEANEPGRFVTFNAAELSTRAGDHNVYFPGNEALFVDHDPRDWNERSDDWEKLEGLECMTIPHHFAGSMRPWDWSVFNPKYQPVAEIFSNHGRAEYPGNDPHYCWHKNPTVEGCTWVEQLNEGRLLGAIASSDDHWARPGNCGLTGVWVPALTRDAVYSAIKERRCCATMIGRAILHFSVNGSEMGQKIKSAGPPRIQIRAAAPGLIEKVEIIRNGESVYIQSPNDRQVEVDWTDTQLEDAYYYVRLTLAPEENVESYMKDRQTFVWSSPVWVS